MGQAIKFTVLGKPQPAGSKRAFPFKRKSGKLGVNVTDANPNARDWKEAIRSIARENYDGPLLDGPLIVNLTFFVVRPKGHHRTGKNSHLLRDSAPEEPTTRPDLLKLCRTVEDALTGVIWRDDSQITGELLTKLYGEPARVEVQILER